MSQDPGGPLPSTALADVLHLVSRAGRSIAVNLHHGDAALGCVMLVRGRVAWAVSREQPVMLGDVLVQRGHLSRAQLATATAAWREAGGRVKLGAVLEELGLIGRPALRECLLLHTREALRSLLRRDDLRISASGTVREEDEALLFDLDEVLAGPAPAAAPPGAAAALHALFAAPGYQACLVASAGGGLLAAHAAGPGLSPGPLASRAAALLLAAGRLAEVPGLEAPGLVTSRHAGGAVLAAWVEPGRALAAAVLRGEGAEAAGLAPFQAALPALGRLGALGCGAALARELLGQAASAREQLEAVRLALQLRLGELHGRGEPPGELPRLAEVLARGAADPAADHGALLASAAASWAAVQGASA